MRTNILETQNRLNKELDDIRNAIVLDLDRAKIDIANMRKKIVLESQLEMINWFLSDDDSVPMTPKLEKRLFNLNKLVVSTKEDIFKRD